MRHIWLAALVVAFPATSSNLIGQPERPAPVSTTRLVVINSLLGGFTAGITSTAGRRSFWKPFLRGSAGGAVAYGGKRIIAEQGSLASWSGRQIAAIGASEVRNAGSGRRLLEEIVLPLGPVRMYATTKGSLRVRPKLDLITLVGTVSMARRPYTSFDPALSLSHGAIIFTMPEPVAYSPGSVRLGVIRVIDKPMFAEGELYVQSSLLAHEVVHLAQNDFINTVGSNPLETLILGRSHVGRIIHRYVDFGSVNALAGGLNELLDLKDRPYEREAYSLAPGYLTFNYVRAVRAVP